MDLFEEGVERRGYLLKEQVKDGEELARALKTVAAGGSYVDASVIGPLIVRGYQSNWLLEHLTPRELDILRLVAEGHSNAGIAAITGITVRGVERHVNGIFAKLGLSEDADVNRRVKAAIMYLSAPPTG
jgi:DNA-binding NarL/FixJ family response regulator